MASFAELIYGTAQNVAQNQGGDIAANVAKGAELALTSERVKAQRLELENKMKELEATKVEKLYNYVKEARNYQNSQDRNNYLKSALGYRNAMGVSPDKVSDQAILSMGSDENMGRAYTLQMYVQEGTMKPEEAIDLWTNPMKQDQFAKIVPTPFEFMNSSPDLTKAQKEVLDRQSQERQAQARANAASSRGGEIQGRFEQAQKTKLADKVTALGLPGLRTAMNSMDKNIPGGLDGYKPGTPIPGITGSEGALPTNRLKGKANKLRGDALSVGNQIIKLRTGAAMSDGEAGRILTEIGFTPVIGEGGRWTGLVWNGKTSEDSFMNGMRRARNILQSQESVYRNAYGEQIFEEVMGPNPAGGPPVKMFTIGGKNYSEAALRKFLKDLPDDPAVPEVKRQLGIK